MLKQFKNSLLLWSFASIAFSMSACGIFWAGGVDEETNTVAFGGPEDETVNELPNEILTPVDVIDTIIHKSGDTLRVSDSVYLDPSAEKGVAICPVEEVEDVNLPPTVSFKYLVTGHIITAGTGVLDIDLMLADSVLHVQSDIYGVFGVADLPNGTFPMLVKTSNGSAPDAAYLLQHNSGKVNVFGPVPPSIISSLQASDLIAPPLQTVDVPDVIGTTVPSDSTPVPDEPPQDTVVNVGGKFGYDGSSYAINVNMPHEPDYGLVYHWDADNIPANGSTQEENWLLEYNLSELTIEVTFKINSAIEDFSFNKNVFGKKGLFNLALVKIKCWTQEPALAFFIGNGYDYTSCKEKAVISSAELEIGKEITVTAVWLGKYVMLYKDGFKIAELPLTTLSNINQITTEDIFESPFMFGHEDLDITIIDARLGNKAISSADVLYRHYLKGGAQ